ncbi:MAG: phosphatidylglycerophosphatase A [Candidatus Omnitrophica bacterium]|nr:phosphatidylglycerophosphatase A [Candidatus Omnitrophota bacterium]
MDLRKQLTKIITTFFYFGYFPFAPGTFGSLGGVIIFCLLKDNRVIYGLVTGLIILSGLIFAGEAERIFAKKDAGFIVIDEVGGMLLSLIFLPYDIRLVVVAFLIFRILDIFKPYPASRFQNLRGGWGVMSDDIVVGIYTNIILQVVVRAASFKAS